MSNTLEEARDFAKLLEGGGVAPDAAWKEALRRYPDAEVAQEAEQLKRADVLEKEEHAVVRKMALAVGMRVYNTSQARAAKVAPGIPDLILTHEDRAFFGFFEVKRQAGGRLSTAQQDFARECHAGGVPCGCGDRYDFARWLEGHGFTAPAIPA